MRILPSMPLLLALTPCLAQEGEVIREIRFENLRRLSRAEVFDRMSLRVGDVYETKRVDEDLKRLYESGEFRRIEGPFWERRPDGGALVFRFEENQRILRVIFSGNRKLSEGKLSEGLLTAGGQLLNEYRVDRDAEGIRKKYLEKGYLFVDVAHRIQPVPGGVDLTFVIHEGPWVAVSKVRFTGNESVSARRLRKLMETRSRHWFFGLLSSGYYDQEKLERDVQRIRAYYYNEGYLDAVAFVDRLEFDGPKRHLEITIRVVEGQRYYIQGFRFTDMTLFTEEEVTEELNVRRLIGQPYLDRHIQAIRLGLRRLYEEKAYLNTWVTPRPAYGDRGDQVTATFHVEEGKRILADEIIIEGNKETRKKVILRQVTIKPGDLVSSTDIEKTKSRLARLQFFEEIRIDWDQDPEAERSPFHVRVKEAAPGQFILGFGIQSATGFIGRLGLRHRNFDITDVPRRLRDFPWFTGGGQILDLDAQPGTRYSRYRLGFTDPYFLDTRNSFSVSGTKHIFHQWDYVEDRLGGKVSLGHYFDADEDIVGSVGYRYDLIDIRRVEPDAPRDALAVKGSNRVSAPWVGLDIDKLYYQPLLGPYRGYRVDTRFEVGGGPFDADVDFTRLEVQLWLYRTIYRDLDDRPHIVSLTNKVGWMEPYSNTKRVPIFERFFLGGARTVRGFRTFELGPHQNRDPVGGTGMFFGKLEYTFPLFERLLRGVLFFDYGLLEDEIQDLSFGRMRATPGVGIEINLQVLGMQVPIGLYFGHAILSEREDRTRDFLFSLGGVGLPY